MHNKQRRITIGNKEPNKCIVMMQSTLLCRFGDCVLQLFSFEPNNAHSVGISWNKRMNHCTKQN